MQKPNIRYCLVAQVLLVAGCGGSPERGNSAAPDGGSWGADDGTDGSPFLGVDAGDADGVGGPDGGGQYDGVSDAGRVDAGSDADSSEGGQVDASTVAGTSDAGATDAGATDAGGIDPFPLVVKNGNFLIASPQVITITFASDANGPLLQAFADWVVKSTYLSTVGADYGVGLGTNQNVTVSDLPAATVASGGTPQSYIFSKILDGTLPAPQPPTVAGTPGNTIYMIYYPPGIAGVLPRGAGGFHRCAKLYPDTMPVEAGPNPLIGFAVIQSGSTSFLQEAGSHELVEQATNACGTDGYSEKSDGTAWDYVGGEVGDLCYNQFEHDASGYWVQRIWSTSAAHARSGPLLAGSGRRLPQCLVFPGHRLVAAPVGGTVTFDLTGWSVGASAPWTLNVASTGFTPAFSICSGSGTCGPFNPKPTLSTTAMSDGQHVTTHTLGAIDRRVGEHGLRDRALRLRLLAVRGPGAVAGISDG